MYLACLETAEHLSSLLWLEEMQCDGDGGHRCFRQKRARSTTLALMTSAPGGCRVPSCACILGKQPQAAVSHSEGPDFCEKRELRSSPECAECKIHLLADPGSLLLCLRVCSFGRRPVTWPDKHCSELQDMCVTVLPIFNYHNTTEGGHI